MRIYSILLCFLFSGTLFAQEKINENDMFPAGDSVIESSSLKMKEEEKKGLFFSGEITSAYQGAANREWFNTRKSSDTTFYPFIQGNLYFDARLSGSYKGFADLESTYSPIKKQSQTELKEIFLDFNLANRIFFRTGKQVLQWGTCYLWNPTDMINIEKKSFLSQSSHREGTFGIKGHIPFGTRANIYGFADMGTATTGNKIGGAGKFELLISATEMSIMGWGKKGYHPVAGYDFSTKLFTLDIVGEVSCSYGNNDKKVVVVQDSPTGTLYAQDEDRVWTPRASIGFGRSFNIGDQLEKFSFQTEFFYNGGGSNKNVFSDKTRYAYDTPATITVNDEEIQLPYGDKKTYMSANGLYNPGYYGRYYAALFITINKFIISELTLTLNVINNLYDHSGLVSETLTYQNIHNFKASITFDEVYGKDNREYTSLGYAGDVIVKASISF